ncbi:MAG: bifunctional protein-serine/threonine kinase/phosphatase, partial [Rhodospirillaceae bacterium]|nr:bifunctional protein-serine/threonine kinase/phosphatase [Rhodospirillaceae bacterium]
MEATSHTHLSVTIGQHSAAGRKPSNQDFHGALVPEGSERLIKGITLAVADGISSSTVSHEAAENAVKALMTDYYSTSDAWTVKTAACRVISATNSWLYGENRRARVADMNHGRVCTLSALILKGCNAHIFHIGDSRIWRVSNDSLEPLTEDHRIVLSESENYLGRSIGSTDQVEVDYRQEILSRGDIFLLTTDGLHEFWDPLQVLQTIRTAPSFDIAAEKIVQDALDRGSNDNLTLQIARIDNLPAGSDSSGLVDDTLSLPIGELPKAGSMIDGFRIERQIVNSARSHIYLAVAPDDTQVVLKFPSVDMRDNPDYLRRFVMEEWISRRIHSPH